MATAVGGLRDAALSSATAAHWQAAAAAAARLGPKAKAQAGTQAPRHWHCRLALRLAAAARGRYCQCRHPARPRGPGGSAAGTKPSLGLPVTRSPIQVGFTFKLQESPGPAGTGVPVHVAAAQSLIS